MKNHKPVSLFFAVAVIGAFAMTASAAWAGQGAFMFHGSVVNAGCDSQIVSALASAPHSKMLQPAPDVTVGLRRTDDACHSLAVPVQAGYSEMSTAEPNSRAGIVTLTYQ